MASELCFDFVVDNEKNSITVKREFAAGRQLVWDCHTKRELLDQWFAPKPLTTKTKHMEFKEGGYYPELVDTAAANLEPHLLATALRELANALHSFYDKHKV